MKSLRFLIIGDSHIPRRAKEVSDIIYREIQELTREGLFDYTFFTGDLINCPKLINFLTSNTKVDVFIVIGNMDYFDGNRDAPVYQKKNVSLNDKKKEDLVIGLTHGAQISPRGDRMQLEKLAIEKGFNILITGHTHKEDIYLTKKGILLINPGSVTGAWSFVASGIPSFVVMKVDVDDSHVNVKLYQLDKKSSEMQKQNSFFIFKNNRLEYQN